jgi:hypothetical protein
VPRCSIIFVIIPDCYRICEELQAGPKVNSAVQHAAIKRDFRRFNKDSLPETGSLSATRQQSAKSPGRRLISERRASKSNSNFRSADGRQNRIDGDVPLGCHDSAVSRICQNSTKRRPLRQGRNGIKPLIYNRNLSS